MWKHEYWPNINSCPLLPTVAMRQKNKSLCAVFSFCTVENMYYLCSYLKERKSEAFKQNDLCWEASENSNLHLPCVQKVEQTAFQNIHTPLTFTQKGEVRWGGVGWGEVGWGEGGGDSESITESSHLERKVYLFRSFSSVVASMLAGIKEKEEALDCYLVLLCSLFNISC